MVALMIELIRTPRRWSLHLRHRSSPRLTLRLRRTVIVLVALLLTAAVSYIASPDNTSLVLMGLLAIAGGLVTIPVFLRWPGLGLLLMIPANMVIPFSVGTGTETGIPATLLLIALLAALWLYDMAFVRRKWQLIDAKPIAPLLLFLVVSVVSFFVGQLTWFFTSSAPLTAQIGGLSVFFFSALGFLVAAHQFRELRWLEWFTWLFLAFGGAFLLTRIVPGFFRYSETIFTWGATSSQFWNWLLAMTFGQLLFNRKLRAPARVVLVALLAAGIYAAFVQAYEWRSGWLPPLISMTVIAALFDWRLAALIGVGGLLMTPGVLQELIATDEYSYSTRLDAWIILLEIIRANPILGLGPANYYYYTPLYEIRGYSVRFNSHNQYLDLIAQTGIAGLVMILWFFVAIGRAGWQLRERVPGGFARAYVYATLGGLAGTVASGMLGDWFLPFVYNVSIVGMRSSIMGWLFLGGLVAIEQMLKDGRLQPAGDGP